jgi:hypothetical protein
MASPYRREPNGKWVFDEQVFSEDRDRLIKVQKEAWRVAQEYPPGSSFLNEPVIQQFIAQAAVRLAFRNEFPKLLKILNFSPEQKAELKEIIDDA